MISIKRFSTSLLFFLYLTALCLAGEATISGKLMNGGPGDSSYYYISLGSYTDSNSLQSQVFIAYPTKGGHGIWYDNTAWTLDQNRDGQHVTVERENIADGSSLDSLVGQTFTFTYQTDNNNIPVCSIFAGHKSWLVVILAPVGNVLQNVSGATLHSSLGYSYNYNLLQPQIPPLPEILMAR